MPHRPPSGNPRGFFAVGVFHPKREINVGSLFRSATLYGAAFVFTVGARYHRQAADTTGTALHMPLHHYGDIEDLVDHLPHSCPLVGVELDAESVPLAGFTHPVRAAYLLGAEDHGLPPEVLKRCHHLVRIESFRAQSMNVACAGTVLLYDRHIKTGALSGGDPR